jgi:hypothetical protein
LRGKTNEVIVSVFSAKKCINHAICFDERADERKSETGESRNPLQKRRTPLGRLS